MRKLVFAALAALALLCPRAALAQYSVNANFGSTVQTIDIMGSVTTISAQCSTPTAGCAAGQFASIKLGGRNSVTAQIVTSNFTGTLQAYVSIDNGATWVLTLVRTSSTAFTGSGSAASSGAFAANTTTTMWPIIIPYPGVTDVMLASTAAVTNTATVQLTASNAQNNVLGAAATVKGTQPTVGITTQDMKDAGRSFVVLGADGVTPAIAETLITVSQNKAGTVTGSVTTYAISANKTLRLQSLACSFTAGATANRVRVALRLNTGGACIASSGLLMPAMELAPTYGTATAAEGGAYGEIPFPDGLELSGASWNICLSESATAAAGTLTCTLTGYEY